MRQLPSPQEISQRFYRSSAETDSAAVADGAQSRDLTIGARYVIRAAKKILGQQSAEAENRLPSEEELLQLIRHVEEKEGEALSERERTAAVAALAASFDHYDILTPLIENSDINDIIVRAFNDISVQRNRENIQTDIRFPDHDAYRAFVENLLKRVGKSCTVATPVVDAAIDPNVRACVTHESFSPAGSGPMLTLRIARHRRITLDGLAHYRLAPKPVLQYLAALVSSGSGTVLIAGEVGTGKTTLVKALAGRIPEQEAILIIEDTNELILDRPFVRTLLTREANTEGSGRISPALAIRTGMRMAMNRLILGEMRDAESAEAFIDVCASGHCGMSTIHARSAKDALARLELFLSRAQPGVGPDTLRRQIANAVSVVAFLGVEKHSRQRRILEIIEVGSFSDGAVQFSPIYRYAPAHQQSHYEALWVRESGISLFQESLQKQGITLPPCGSTVSFETGDSCRFSPEHSQ
jgi:pilus assembly protein CpaF